MSYDDAHDPDLEPGIEEAFFDPVDRDAEAEPSPPPPASGSLASMLSVLLAGVRTPEEIGLRALLLAWAVRHPHAPRTVRQMAERMGCSPSEAHRRGTSFVSELARIRGFLRNSGTGGPRV